MKLTDADVSKFSLNSLQRTLAAARAIGLKPPPDLSLSEWAVTHFVLSPEASAESGKYTYARAPYQKDMLDACSDSEHQEVVFCTSAQIGKTTILLALLLYYIHQNPAPILLVQPTKELAGSFSKDRLAPALRDSKALKGLVSDVKSRDTSNTILSKSFAGGVLNIVGSNAPSSLASRPVRVVLADEVDRYPLSAGTEGDPLQLAIKRSANFFNRKIIMVSTPTDKLISRIWARYESSDRRKYHIKCVHCGDTWVPIWEHVKWQKDSSGMHLPETALLHCPHCGCGHNDAQRNAAVVKGHWIAENPTSKVAGFHLSALISPWSELERLVVEWVQAQSDVQKLKTFFNTQLGLPWEDRGKNIDDINFQGRLEDYDVTTIPVEVAYLTAGCDVQDDRIEAAVYGWGNEAESWHIESKVFNGNPANPNTWAALASYLKTTFKRADGVPLRIRSTCIDSGGHFTQECYAFCKKHAQHNWWAIKGRAGSLPIFPKRPSYTKLEGKVYIIGVDSAKEAIYAWLENTTVGPGFVHFSDRCDAEFFSQIASEKKILSYRNGYTFYSWRKDPNRRNEQLDCFVYALAAKEGLNISAKNVHSLLRKKYASLTEKEETPTQEVEVVEEQQEEVTYTPPPAKKIPQWKQNIMNKGSTSWR